MNTPKVNLDESQFQEVTQSSYIAGMIFELAIQEHNVVKQTPEMKASAKAVQTAMQDFLELTHKVADGHFGGKPHIHGKAPSMRHKAECYDQLKAWFEEDEFLTASMMANWDVVEFNLNSQIANKKNLDMYSGEPTASRNEEESGPTVNQCPNCESFNVAENIQPHHFDYGSDNPVPLVVSVPVMTCNACKEEWLDYRAAELEHRMIRMLFPRK